MPAWGWVLVGGGIAFGFACGFGFAAWLIGQARADAARQSAARRGANGQ